MDNEFAGLCVAMAGCNGKASPWAERLAGNGVRLVCWDPDPDAASELGKRVGAEVLATLEELLAAGADGAIVSGPLPQRAAWAPALLAAGAHVMVTPPVAPTLEETRAILRAAERSGRIVSHPFDHLLSLDDARWARFAAGSEEPFRVPFRSAANLEVSERVESVVVTGLSILDALVGLERVERVDASDRAHGAGTVTLAIPGATAVIATRVGGVGARRLARPHEDLHPRGELLIARQAQAPSTGRIARLLASLRRPKRPHEVVMERRIGTDEAFRRAVETWLRSLTGGGGHLGASAERLLLWQAALAAYQESLQTGRAAALPRVC